MDSISRPTDSVLLDEGSAVNAVLRLGQKTLGSSNDGHREAEILLSGLLGVDRVALYRDNIRIPGPLLAEYKTRLLRRASGEPVQYILGHVDFLGFRLRVGPGVLVPRPETELWLSDLLGQWPAATAEAPARIMDLCTGSGCLALALSRRFPESQILAVDRSEEALTYARLNVRESGVSNVTLLCSDLFSGFPLGPWRADLLVCNPPYITEADFSVLETTVRDWEPEEALRGGEDGLAYYRAVSARMGELLSPRGLVAFEVGAGQADAVSEILRENGIRTVSVYRDLAGHDRAVFGARG